MHVDIASDDEVLVTHWDLWGKHKLTWRSVVAMQHDLNCAIKWLIFSSNLKHASSDPHRTSVQLVILTRQESESTIDLKRLVQRRLSKIINHILTRRNHNLLIRLWDSLTEPFPCPWVTPESSLRRDLLFLDLVKLIDAVIDTSVSCNPHVRGATLAIDYELHLSRRSVVEHSIHTEGPLAWVGLVESHVRLQFAVVRLEIDGGPDLVVWHSEQD